MATTTEIEARLRGYARQYDQEFPSTAEAESRTIARITITPRPLTRISEPRHKWVLAGVLVRSLAIVCLVLIAVGALAIGVTRLRAAQRHNVPTIGAPGKLDVYFSGIDFISADQGWMAETRSSPSLAGPTVLFRTTDGGHTWQSQLTWDGPGPAQIRFSLDGVQGLVVGRGGVPLFTTSDGGTHWQRQQIPSQLTSADLIYFLDAREGWIIGYLNEATAGFAGVFHTTDSGRHWTQTARLDVGQVFTYGQRGGSLQGSLTFRDSSTGWFAGGMYSETNMPIVEPHIYLTHDGGRTWAVQKLPTQVGIAMDSSNAGVSLPQFFNQQDGVLLVSVIASTPSGADSTHQAPSVQGIYFFSTTDGGDQWSGPRPISIPGGLGFLASLVLIDASHWVVLSTAANAQTNDAGRHWEPLGWSLPAEVHILTVQFQDAQTAWADVVVATVHPALAMLRTTDGGAHWSRVSVPAVR